MSSQEMTCIISSTNENDIRAFFRDTQNKLAELTTDEKSTLVDGLLTRLMAKTWSEETMTLGLQLLKLLGRTKQGAEALFSEKGIQVLLSVSGMNNIEALQDSASTHEALKCLANCILLDDKTKAYLERNNGITACGRLLQCKPNLSMDVQFLVCRILFFMTVNRSDIVKQLMDCDIAGSTEKVLKQNVEKIRKDKTIDTRIPINPVSVVNEALKMLFNMILAYSRHQQQETPTGTVASSPSSPPSLPSSSSSTSLSTSSDRDNMTAPEYFSQCLLPIFEIILVIPPPQPLPLSPPHSHAIHALMQYPYSVIAHIWREHKNQLFESPDITVEQGRAFVASKMTELLQQSLMYLIPNEDPDDQAPPDRQQYNIDAILSPIILVIRNLAHGDLNLRPLIANALLPQQSDRMMPVNQGKGLPAYLIRLMTSTMLPQTRDAVCETLFVLCDEDATTFTQKVGYGNAIGFLVNKGIAMEPPQEHHVSDGDEEADIINPITGQYVSAEKDQGPSLADMTDEEKEREAEKLFVLFERLKKTGIIDVENPVARAMRENTANIEEVVSSDDDDNDHNDDDDDNNDKK